MFESSLDEDTKAALLADPAAVIGKLLARAAMTGAQIALHQVPQIVPRMVSSMTNQQRGQAEAWSRFTSVNKDLASPEFAPSLEVAARTLKATGKNYTDDEAIVALGRMVRVMHNLPDPTEAAAPVVAPAAPVAPFTPVARGGVAPAPTAKPTNKWTDLIDN